ncbi:hypothetical protein VTI28DRAFT_4845 [Corynascus sepedonium]
MQRSASKLMAPLDRRPINGRIAQSGQGINSDPPEVLVYAAISASRVVKQADCTSQTYFEKKSSFSKSKGIVGQLLGKTGSCSGDFRIFKFELECDTGAVHLLDLAHPKARIVNPAAPPTL